MATQQNTKTKTKKNVYKALYQKVFKLLPIILALLTAVTFLLAMLGIGLTILVDDMALFFTMLLIGFPIGLIVTIIVSALVGFLTAVFISQQVVVADALIEMTEKKHDDFF